MEDEKRWHLEFWRDEEGGCPVCDFMRELRTQDQKQCTLVWQKINRYQSWELEQVIATGDFEDLKNGAWEFKISVSKIKIRMIGSLYRGDTPPRFVAANAFKKKTRKLNNNDIMTAINRLAKKQ
jgi:Phage derived protein Gp49-like (DUF891)